MKTYLCLLSGTWALLGVGCVATPPVSAEPVPVVMGPPGPPPPAPVTDATPVATAVAEQPAPPEAGSLEELVAPIALYPDALIALILPASTASSDVVLAARFLNSGGNASEIDSRAWDDSVKGLAHYPEVIKWMDENLAWTQRLGEAYLNEPQEVMAAVQRDRARAQANGVLTSTPQQQVVVEDSTIRIIPAQADVIYIPRYDPEIVYVDRPVYVSPDPWLTFGIGFGVGSWLAYDCDWHQRVIWIDPHRRDHWREHRDWRQPHYSSRSGFAHEPGWRQWTPPPGRRPPNFANRDRTRDWVRPTPMPGTPRHEGRDRDVSRDRGGDHRWTPRDRVAEGEQPRLRPGARVPRPVDPAAGGRRERTMSPPASRPGATPLVNPAAPASAPQTAPVPAPDHRRDQRTPRPRDNDQSNHSRRWTPAAPAPAVGGSQPVATVQPSPSRRPGGDAFGRRGDGSGERRSVPANAAPRSVAPARVMPAPTPVARVAPPAGEQRRMDAPRPAAAAPTPPPVVRSTPPPAQRTEVASGNRVPQVQRQDSDRGSRTSRGRDRDP